ncbi:hypothetical protein B0H17DRAFT_1133854 [Mycena rosella]|uniref:Uncharacterized protein n=1 Tax=Mycena rosella TaxID=1033263 RepID=A0AAD7GJU5_MYCRO|nr:hypothetical protein B0H17DRAFT_1133854 [Mycena rosella]
MSSTVPRPHKPWPWPWGQPSVLTAAEEHDLPPNSWLDKDFGEELEDDSDADYAHSEGSGSIETSDGSDGDISDSEVTEMMADEAPGHSAPPANLSANFERESLSEPHFKVTNDIEASNSRKTRRRRLVDSREFCDYIIRAGSDRMIDVLDRLQHMRKASMCTHLASLLMVDVVEFSEGPLLTIGNAQARSTKTFRRRFLTLKALHAKFHRLSQRHFPHRMAVKLPGIAEKLPNNFRKTKGWFSTDLPNCDPLTSLWSLKSTPSISLLRELEHDFPQEWLNGAKAKAPQAYGEA